MATFARSAFNVKAYSAIRPVFPPQFFEGIYAYHANAGKGKGEFKRCVDLGCGTGQATTVLAEKFDEVIGVEPSGPMVERARNLLRETEELKVVGDKVRFVQSAAEELPFLEDESVDMVTASQAAHWFDYSRLWPELGRVLKPNGAVAFFGYGEMRLPDHPSSTSLIGEFTHGPELDSNWEQPGRSIVEALLDPIPSPGLPFDPSTEQRIKYSGSYFPKPEVPDPQPVILSKRMNRQDLDTYARTFSALHTFWEKHPEDKQRSDGDFATRFVARMMQVISEDGGNTNEFTVDWPAGLILVKKAA
ncbi:S-adenosyl-L-methionine-dependent methyltransferase [Dacryopinax primogenitus]|uniref:S-adenosyl-L-methionine-dependent methyltransferase n=1 Tax=Dacryopinax primogenitus (strain DJM 731) TaxID=1858805 RepID=M5FTW0_DACPD|nr:S-adenosyl-L-methionine-dependent methyltransferase [Dacryopinax primogenitus]EJT99573.1 S-adenosyl-L-methionine-dependent methyltransferase [Dacryopinax primogenitus]